MSEIGYGSKTVSLPSYKKAKIKMLEKDFMIVLTQEDRAKINSFNSESDIDRYARTIILNRL